MGTLEWSSS